MVTKGWSLRGARGWAGASPGPGAGHLLLGGPEAARGRRQGPCPGGAGAPRAHPAVRGPRVGTGTGSGSGAAEGRGRPLRPRPQPGCAASHRAVAARPLSDWLGASRALNYP